MKIEINIKMTKELTERQTLAVLSLTNNEAFLYLMAIRQEIFETLALDDIELDKIVQVEYR
jgi:hypothetical protein